MQSGRVLVASTNDLVQTYFVVTVIYVVVNVLISLLAQWLEKVLNGRRGVGRVSFLGRARRSAVQ